MFAGKGVHFSTRLHGISTHDDVNLLWFLGVCFSRLFVGTAARTSSLSSLDEK
jgi:hypothetical protein